MKIEIVQIHYSIPPQGRAFWDPKFKGTARSYFFPCTGDITVSPYSPVLGILPSVLAVYPQGLAFSGRYSDPIVGPYFLVVGNY